jgi:hypothetical protein
MGFLNHREEGMVSIRFSSFLLYNVYTNFTLEIHKRLREFEEIRKRLRDFEEIEISGQSCRGDGE